MGKYDSQNGLSIMLSSPQHFKRFVFYLGVACLCCLFVCFGLLCWEGGGSVFFVFCCCFFFVVVVVIIVVVLADAVFEGVLYRVGEIDSVCKLSIGNGCRMHTKKH